MIQTLKHFAARIWFAVLMGGLISLWMLPHVQSRIGLDSILIPVGLIVVLIFWGSGWLFSRWAARSVKQLVREAGGCERDGMYPEAEDAFRKAVAVFDSFLISPFVRQTKSIALAARMARYYLARADESPEAERFLAFYLYDHPADEAVAENWLTRMDGRGRLKENYQEVAQRIGNAHPHNKTIQSILARFYLLFERTDFSALQTYRRMLEQTDPAPVQFIQNLAHLFLRERRADQWALQIYLEAIDGGDDRSELLRGVAACLRWSPAVYRAKPLLQRALTYLDGIDELQLEQIGAAFQPLSPPPVPRKHRREMGVGSSLRRTAQARAKRFSRDIYAVVTWFVRRIAPLGDLLKHSRQIRRVRTAILLSGLAAGVAYLMINTVSHLMKTQTAGKAKTPPKEVVVTDPFTIQVAAYLKPDYAHGFVEQLKKQGLDAYWTEVVSGNKRWYQVRISHFTDKQSARNYGEALKAKGIIEDFYVANFRRPGR